jgi:hypothetical protein
MSVIQQIRFIVVPHIVEDDLSGGCQLLHRHPRDGHLGRRGHRGGRTDGQAINLSTVNYRWLEYFIGWLSCMWC